MTQIQDTEGRRLAVKRGTFRQLQIVQVERQVGTRGGDQMAKHLHLWPVDALRLARELLAAVETAIGETTRVDSLTAARTH